MTAFSRRSRFAKRWLQLPLLQARPSERTLHGKVARPLSPAQEAQVMINLILRQPTIEVQGDAGPDIRASVGSRRN
jgi:hypothetical protein